MAEGDEPHFRQQPSQRANIHQIMIRRWMTVGRLRSGAAALGTGLLLAAALPPWGWWPLAFAGLALLDRLIANRPRGARFRRGLVIGLGLYIPSLWWMVDLTPPGYVIASVAYSALLGGAMALVPATAPGRWVALPGAIAVTELLRWSWPFGGVPLSNLAIGQVNGPLAPILRLGGPFLLVAVTVTVGVGVAALLHRRWIPGGMALGLVAVLLAAAQLAPRGDDLSSVEVALVQGGGPQGTRAEDTDMREVFERHYDTTSEVEPPVDAVFWPEDVVDVEGPVQTNQEGDELADLAEDLEAPLVVGVVEGDGPDHFRNASVVYSPEGEIVDRYDKVHRVPFGEYVPLRWLVEPFAGDDLTAREAIAGESPAELDLPFGRVAVAISWEVFFPDRVREGVRDGGTLVINPTNGSSYTGTLVQTQQVASSQMRAIETGRWVLQIAPTGFTAIIGPDGTVHQRSSISESTVLQGTVELRGGQTPYTRLGLLPGWLMVIVSLTLGWELRHAGRDRERSDNSASANGSATEKVKPKTASAT